MSPAEIQLAMFALKYIGIPITTALIAHFAEKRKTKKEKKKVNILAKNIEKYSTPNKEDREENVTSLIKTGVQIDMIENDLEKEFNKTIKNEIEQKGE